jgi:hypothetical protein
VKRIYLWALDVALWADRRVGNRWTWRVCLWLLRHQPPAFRTEPEAPVSVEDGGAF